MSMYVYCLGSVTTLHGVNDSSGYESTTGVGSDDPIDPKF